MLKRLICLILALVSVFAICSCIKSEVKYDYELSEYLSLPDYRSQEYKIKEDDIKIAIAAYLLEYAQEYKVKRGDKIQVDIKFYSLKSPTIDAKDKEITELFKDDLWIDRVGTPNTDGKYQISSLIEENILGAKIGATVSKLLVLDNTFFDEKYRGQKVFVDITINNRICEVGDVLTASYTGYYIDSEGNIVKEDGKEKTFDQSDNSPFYIGSHLAIDEFEQGLVGMTIGEEKNIYATFPKDYEPEPTLAGKKVLFKVKIKSFFVPHTYNDDFVKTYFNNFSTIAEFEASLRKEYLLNAVFEYISKNTQIYEFPDDEYDATMEELEAIAPTFQSQYNMTIEEYVEKRYQMTVDQYIKSNMKTEMIFYYLADLIGTDATPTETELAAKKSELIETYKKQYMANDGITESQALSKANDYVMTLGDSFIYEQVMYKKIDDVVEKQVTFKEIPSEKTYVFDAQVK